MLNWLRRTPPGRGLRARSRFALTATAAPWPRRSSAAFASWIGGRSRTAPTRSTCSSWRILLVAAIASTLDTILDRAIASPYRLSFGPTVSPATAVELWNPIVASLGALPGALMKGPRARRSKGTRTPPRESLRSSAPSPPSRCRCSQRSMTSPCTSSRMTRPLRRR